MMKVDGLLGIPRKSRNNNFYFASELARGDGETVPLRWNHIKENHGIIGTSTLSWDDTLEQLSYNGIVTSAEAETAIRKMVSEGHKVKVSLGLQAESHQKICKPDKTDCMDAAINVKFKEMSVLSSDNSPGIPEASLNISESVTELSCGMRTGELFAEFNIKDENIITSISNDLTKIESMTNEITSNKEATIQEQVVAALAKIESDKAEVAKLETIKAEAVKLEADKIEAAKTKTEAVVIDEAKIAKLVEERVAEATLKIEKSISESYEKKHEVSESMGNAIWTEAKVEEHVKLMDRVLQGESVSIKIDKEEFINKHSVFQKSVFSEAVSTSGTIPGINTGAQILILPGGILQQSIRPWVEVRVIKQGEDKVRFYTLDIPAFGNITEHVSTEITPATHTLTGFDVAADTPRGFRQNVLKVELEKYPADLLEKIRETARIRSVEDEVVNVLDTTAASTSVDFGANHFSGSAGTLVTDETSEDDTGEFVALGLERAKQRLQEQGHQCENGAAVAAISPRAQRTLIEDTALVRFMQQASPDISRLGRISMYFGIEIFITNALSIDNNSRRNIVFMKGLAFGLVTARDLELEFDKNINRQSVDIVATHRINSVIKDATAYVILSSKND